MSSKLFVGNLSFDITENDLHDAFAAHGTVVEANLMVDRVSGRPRGFGFVTMGTPEEAQKAIDALNGKPLVDGQLNTSISKNPLFAFKARGIKAGDKLTVAWNDSAGDKRQDEISVP